MKMEMKMKNWIKTVCFLLWTCVMCTACIDDDVEEGTVDLQTGESIPVFSVVMDDGQIITSETLKGGFFDCVFSYGVSGLPERTSCAAKNIYGLRSKNPDGLY